MCKLKQKWTIEKCLASAKKFSTRSDWQKGDKNAYITAHRRGWLEDCCAHMHKLKQQWTKERCMASAQQFNTRLDWHLGDSGAYSAAHRYGWFEDCCTHMKTKKNVQPQKWTKEKCLVSAQQFNSRGGWYYGDNKAYNAARENGWLEACCAHMHALKQKWTKEKCLVSANKFMNPGDWRKGDKNAYDAARRHDWFEECCAHMSRK
tara:strand:- start:1703 stop:2317 length:615 start_codon:yes stop_codon:yes gene_type:complete